MKILIMYVSAGAGHRRAAEAICSYFKNKNEHELKIIDCLDYTNPFFRFLYSKGYMYLVIHFPTVWRLSFQTASFPLFSYVVKAFRYLVNRFNTQVLNKFILDYKPDVIVSTHFMPNEVVTFLKTWYKLNTRLICIVTDFIVHSFWVASAVDRYIVGAEITKGDLLKKKVRDDLIKIIGIPVEPDFYKKQDRKIVAPKYGLLSNKFTVLIFTATLSAGPIENLIDHLKDEEVQILLICGKNKRLYNELMSRATNLIRIFSFVDDVSEFMTVADIVITKPGGLTVSESLIKGLAMIFNSAIPGQETANANLMQQLGIGFVISDPIKIKNKILELKNNPAKMITIKENIIKFANQNTLIEIADEICQGSTGPAR